MKLRLLLCFIIGACSAQAQSSVYKNFPDTNFIWVETSNGMPGGGCCCGGICINDYSYQVFFDGDTSFNNQVYSKVYETGSMTAYIVGPPSCPPWCNNVTSTTSYYTHRLTTFLRHDAAAKKVYEGSNGQEILLYDFTVQVGDSARGRIGNPTLNYISAIDSIQIGNQFHKRFWLTTWNGHQAGYDSAYAWIAEGLGGSQGMLYDIYPVFERIGTIVCAYNNMAPVYPANQPGCTIPTGKEELLPVTFTFELVPNPASGVVKITGGEIGGTIVITDVQGKTIFTGRCTGETTDVKLAGIPKGVYAVKLTNGSGQSATRKLVIQ